MLEEAYSVCQPADATTRTIRPILDACCGGKSFWYDKTNPDVVFMDIRTVPKHVYYGTGHMFEVSPCVTGDFRDMPWGDNHFRMTVFDPPHVADLRATSITALKYGTLNADTWREDIKAGFAECFRVTEPGGFVIFKWSEAKIPWREVKPLAGRDPLFGDRRGLKGNTHWQVFAA